MDGDEFPLKTSANALYLRARWHKMVRISSPRIKESCLLNDRIVNIGGKLETAGDSLPGNGAIHWAEKPVTKTARCSKVLHPLVRICGRRYTGIWKVSGVISVQEFSAVESIPR